MVNYDPSQFIVRLTFSIDAMPVRNISVSSTSYMSRRDSYSLNGAEPLTAAKFSWVSQFSLYSLLNINSGAIDTSQLFSLASANYLSIFGVGLDFSYSLSQNSPYFTFGSWRGFYDFPEDNIRLSFGNIGNSIGNYGGTNVGVGLEKNYSYGSGSAKGHQFEQTVTLKYRSTVKVIMNDRVLYERELAAGTYKLKDFLFNQGSNGIDIVITPVNPTDGEPETIHIEMGYDSRLLAKGESVWGMNFSIPRLKVSSDQGVGISIPWFDGNVLDYRYKQFSAQYWQQTGLTNIFTLTNTFNITPGLFMGTLNGVLATQIGTIQGYFSLSLGSLGPGYTVRLTHRYAPTDSWFGGVDSSIGYTNGTYSLSTSNVAATVGNLNASLSTSGRIGSIARFSLNGSVALPVDTFSPDWSATATLGMNPLKGLSISGSITANASSAAPDKPTIRGSVSISYSIGTSATLSASSDFKNSNNFNVSWRPGNARRDTLQLNLSGLSFTDPLNHTLGMSWSHIGDLFSLSMRQQFSNSYTRSTTSLSLNTSFVFADGVFGMSRSVSENFLLVKPVGMLKGATVSVGRSLDSSPTVLKSVFGTSVYNNLSAYNRNHIVVYGNTSSLFGNSGSFVFEIVPQSRQGFVAKITMSPSYTVSGNLFHQDGTPYIQYSSPVYKMELDEQGMPMLTPVDDYYLFTDQEGRYIISDMIPGNYLFDLSVGESWYAMLFTIPEFEGAEKETTSTVVILDDYQVGEVTHREDFQIFDEFGSPIEGEERDVFGTLLADEYAGVVNLGVSEKMDEQKFWDTIFPSFDESFDSSPSDAQAAPAAGSEVPTQSTVAPAAGTVVTPPAQPDQAPEYITNISMSA